VGFTHESSGISTHLSLVLICIAGWATTADQTSWTNKDALV